MPTVAEMASRPQPPLGTVVREVVHWTKQWTCPCMTCNFSHRSRLAVKEHVEDQHPEEMAKELMLMDPRHWTDGPPNYKAVWVGDELQIRNLTMGISMPFNKLPKNGWLPRLSSDGLREAESPDGSWIASEDGRLTKVS